MWHDSFIYVTWLIHICDMTHSYMWHDSCCIWLSLTHRTWMHPGVVNESCHIHMCDMTHSYDMNDLWRSHVTYMNESCHIYEWVMSHIQSPTYIWMHLGAFNAPHSQHTSGAWGALHAPSCIHICDMTHSYMWHDSFIYATWLIHICDMTHSQHTSGAWGARVQIQVRHSYS